MVRNSLYPDLVGSFDNACPMVLWVDTFNVVLHVQNILVSFRFIKVNL